MSADTQTAVIEMSGVAAVALRDPTRIAVEAVDWRVAAGDFWVLAGMQSTGKSDFLMLTAGLTSPAAGSYRLFGEAMPVFESARLATRLRLGVVFEGGRLSNDLTVAENIALPLRYHDNLTVGEASGRVADLLSWTDLAHRANTRPGLLSHAERRRAGLARALILRPEVLLLDGPLTGLDARQTAWWLGFLDQLSAGHEAVAGRPMTLAVTTETLWPWRGHGRQFALLAERRFEVLGAWEDVEHSTSVVVREMLLGAAVKRI